MFDRNAVLEATFNWIGENGIRAYAVVVLAILIVGGIEVPS